MRIRKNAAKLLLGSASPAAAASVCYSETWPPPAACFSASATAGAASGETLCELNCSPWDVMTEDELLNYCFSPPYFFVTDPNPKKDELDGDRGIIGNIVKPEDHPNIGVATVTSSSSYVAAAEQVDEEKPKRKKTTETKREQNETLIDDNKSIVSEITTAKSEEIIYCKKTDGKRWRCKRPAQLPHYFCGYHIEQSRSYNSAVAAADREMHWRSTVTAEAATGSSYYYYSGFGPRRGKRKGRENGEGSKERHVDHADNNNVVEFCLVDCLDADEDNCYDGCSGEEHKDSGNKQQREVEKRVLFKKKKKKARTRSLKSLL